jgi:hypothetical protein
LAEVRKCIPSRENRETGHTGDQNASVETEQIGRDQKIHARQKNR